MAARIAKEFGGHIDREAIEVMLDQAIQARIEDSVTAIINSYTDAELVLAKAEFGRLTKMSKVARKQVRQ